MEEYLWFIVVLGVIICLVGNRWWRNRRAAKLADDLLANIIKEKDAFRR